MPGAQAYYVNADGTTTPIPDSELQNALFSGTAHYEAGAQVEMELPGGVVEQVPAEQVGAYAKAGYRPISGAKSAEAARAREYSTYGQAATALAEGIGSGLTFGLSNVATTQLGLTTPEEIRARQEYQPAAGLTGEALGTAAGLIATRGASASGMALKTVGAIPRIAAGIGSAAESRVAAALGKGILGRVSAPAAGAALEGAISNATYDIAQASLDDEELTAERILAAGGLGALTGGVIGAGVGGVGVAMERRAVAKAARGAGISAAEEALETASQRPRTAGAAVDALQTESDRAVAAVPEQVGGKPRAELISDASASNKGMQHSARQLSRDWAVKQVLQGSYSSAGKGYTLADEALRGLEDGTRGARMADKIRALDIKTISSPQGIERAAAAGRESAGLAMESVLAEGGATPVSLEPLLAKIDDIRARSAAGFTKTETELAAKLEDELAPLIELATDPTSGGVVPMAKAWEARRSLDAAAKTFKFQKQTAMDSALTEARWALETEVESSFSRVGRQDLADTWKQARGDYHEWSVIHDAAERSARKQVGGAIWNAPRMAGMGAEIAARAAGGALLGGALGGYSGEGAAMGALSGLGMGAMTRAVGGSTYGLLAKLAGVAAESDRITSLAARAIARGTVAKARSAGAGAKGVPTAANRLIAKFKETRSKLEPTEEERTDEAVLIDREYSTRPSTALALSSTRERGRTQLLAKAPIPLQRAGISLTPEADKPSYDLNSVKRWLNYHRGAENPYDVIRDLAKGNMNRDAIDGVRENYPRIWERLQSQVMQQLLDSGEKLPYSRRVFLGTVFQLPADPSLDADFISTMQSLTAPPQPADPEYSPAAFGTPMDAETFASPLMLPSATRRKG